MNNKGFTLIEFIIVLFIIGATAGIYLGIDIPRTQKITCWTGDTIIFSGKVENYSRNDPGCTIRLKDTEYRCSTCVIGGETK